VADKGKVLVVDDDRLVVVMLTYGLSQAGYDVIAADNGDDAIQMARERRPALALLDIRMEGRNGFDVAAVLREQVHIPFMFLSGQTDDDTVRRVKASGALAHLVKPIDVKKIIPAVDAAFSALNARRAAVLAARAREAGPSTAQSTLNSTTSGMTSGMTSGTISGNPAGTMAAPEPMTAAMAMATGVLMHRYSLARAPALERLRKMAHAHGQSVAEHAERILEAVELLSASGRG
jgi:two-component system, response regulator PdtaR